MTYQEAIDRLNQPNVQPRVIVKTATDACVFTTKELAASSIALAGVFGEEMLVEFYESHDENYDLALRIGSGEKLEAAQ